MEQNSSQNQKNADNLIVKSFVSTRPPNRRQFDVLDWRNALNGAEIPESLNRVALYDIYDDAYLDPMLAKQWNKRVENIVNVKWGYFVGEQKHEEMGDLCGSPAFQELLKEIMNQVAWGISVIELDVKTENICGSDKRQLSVFSIPRKHIRPDKGIIVREQYDTPEVTTGINYRTGIYEKYVAEIGEPDDLGLFLKAAPYVILKKGAVSDWALFVQLFGQPFREYRYNGYNEADRIMLEQSAKEMASAPYIILPDGAQILLHEIKNNNKGQIHQDFVSYCDKMITILVLGNTLTTDNNNVGSNALGNVHAKTEDITFVADRIRIMNTLNNKIAPILFNLGFPIVKGGRFKPEVILSIQETLKRLEILKAVKELGAPISDEVIYKESGVSKPENKPKYV